jgi:Laminin G domain
LRFFPIFRRWMLPTAVLLAASAFVGVDSAFGAWTKVAVWQMNEGPNQNVMHDSSGANRDGIIGTVVETDVADPELSGGNTAFRWPGGDLSVENPERLVTVDRSALNPRRDGFEVTIRLKTNATDHNIIQKGQATTEGGMWKIEMDGGRAICSFKGSAGRAAVGSAQTMSLADDEWHRVRCVRRSNGVTIRVDDRVPRTQAGRTGRIANSLPLTIGGKWNCNPPNNVTCQYYVGLVDRVVVRRR